LYTKVKNIFIAAQSCLLVWLAFCTILATPTLNYIIYIRRKPSRLYSRAYNGGTFKVRVDSAQSSRHCVAWLHRHRITQIDLV